MSEDLPNPESREELYLAKAAGESVEVPTPESRKELFLNAIAQGGGGGGTSDFNNLSNRPQLNSTQMTSSTNITNFTGTDGNTAGAQGLVPAPATTDAGKFLKADGTWATAGGGDSSIKTLTSADYNYPTTGTKTHVALWLLGAGIYYMPSGLAYKANSTSGFGPASGELVLIEIDEGNNRAIITLMGGRTTSLMNGVSDAYREFYTRISDGDSDNPTGLIPTNQIANNLTTITADFKYVLNAYQGKVLNDKINSIAIRGAQDPNETTAASIGTIFESTTNGSLWICEGVDDPGSPTEYYWMRLASTDYVDQVQNTLSAAVQNGGTSAPTTATYGEVGTLYSAVVSGTPHVYMCTAYNDVDDEYTWAQIV